MVYDLLGAAYDQDAHLQVSVGFHDAIRALARSRAGARVLDLGCGTGLLTERLARAGCRVRGLDISRSMLRAARRRCRRFGTRVRFVLADLRRFDLPPPAAAAAFACGDVVNHITTMEDLRSFFRSVRRSLEPAGVFVFDALNRWCFENYWRQRTYYYAGKDGDIVMECDWNARRGVGTAAMVVYTRGRGRYIKRHCVLRERLHENATLRRLLLQAGFRRVVGKPWSPWPDQHKEESVDRSLWVATA